MWQTYAEIEHAQINLRALAREIREISLPGYRRVRVGSAYRQEALKSVNTALEELTYLRRHLRHWE